MADIATTRMSSKGQVVIPEEIRERLGLDTGAQFVVVGEGDVVVLKAIKPPSMREFDRVVRGARRAAKQAGLKRGDIKKVVRDVRRAR